MKTRILNLSPEEKKFLVSNEKLMDLGLKLLRIALVNDVDIHSTDTSRMNLENIVSELKNEDLPFVVDVEVPAEDEVQTPPAETAVGETPVIPIEKAIPAAEVEIPVTKTEEAAPPAPNPKQEILDALIKEQKELERKLGEARRDLIS